MRNVLLWLLLCGMASAQQVTSLNVVGVHGNQVTLLVRLNAPAPAQGVAVTISGAAYAATVVGYNSTEVYVSAQLMTGSPSLVATFIASGGGGTASASFSMPQPTPTPTPVALPTLPAVRRPAPVSTVRKVVKLEVPGRVQGVVTVKVTLTKGPADTLFITCGPFLFAKPYIGIPADATQATFNVQAGNPKRDTPAEVRVRVGKSEAATKVVVEGRP